MVNGADTQEQKSPLRVSPLALVPKVPSYEWVLESSLRQWAFYADERYTASGQKLPGNGFDTCIIRLGRKVLIDLDRFDQWILSHRV